MDCDQPLLDIPLVFMDLFRFFPSPYAKDTTNTEDQHEEGYAEAWKGRKSREEKTVSPPILTALWSTGVIFSSADWVSTASVWLAETEKN